MATSGSVVTSSCEGRSMTLNWSCSAQSVANNTSTISWSLVGSGSYSGYVKCGGFYVSIGGNVVCNWSTDSRVQVSPSTTVASGSVTLSHNADGTKSFNVTVQAGIYEYARNCSGSGSFTLNTIARATTPTISPTTVALGSALTISMPRASSSFTHTLKYMWGSLSGTIGTGLGTSATWTPPVSLASQIPNNTSGYGSITCETYNGSTKIGSKYVRFDATVPSSCIPTISSATATVDNSANSVIKGWGLWVAGYSKALVKATAAGNNGSTITGFTISGGASASTTGTSLSYTTGAITKTGSVTFSVVAKDSRGRSSATTTTSAVTVYEYSVPTVTSFTAQRNSSAATKVIVQANWTFSSVNSKNAVTATLYYRASTATSYTTYGTIGKNTATTLTTTFSESTSYDFRIIIKDSVGNSARMDSSISTGEALLDFRTGGKGLAVGKMSESDTFEVALATKFTGAISLKNDSGSVVTLAAYIKSFLTTINSNITALQSAAAKMTVVNDYYSTSIAAVTTSNKNVDYVTYTVPEDGIYMVTGGAQYKGNAPGNRIDFYVQHVHSGTEKPLSATTFPYSQGYPCVAWSGCVAASKGDTIRLRAWYGIAGTINWIRNTITRLK